ncbi:hypothetical protein [Streptomyces kronopolitis]
MVELSTRHPGGAWRHRAPDRESIAEAAPDDGTAILLLEALRRWQVEESDEPVHITRDAVRRTIDYVLSVHYDNVDDADAADTVATLKGFLAALADAAEAHLDTGRVVVREVVARARRLSGQEPNLRELPHARPQGVCATRWRSSKAKGGKGPASLAGVEPQAAARQRDRFRGHFRESRPRGKADGPTRP